MSIPLALLSSSGQPADFRAMLLSAVGVALALFSIAAGFLLLFWRGFFQDQGPGSDEPAARDSHNRRQVVKMVALVLVLFGACLVILTLAYR